MLARTLKVTLIAASLAALTAPAMGETLAIDGQVTLKPTSIETPKRGITMSQVEQRFGAPVSRRDAVGTPPITRWQYANFVVVFEHDRVLHTVVTSG